MIVLMVMLGTRIWLGNRWPWWLWLAAIFQVLWNGYRGMW